MTLNNVLKSCSNYLLSEDSPKVISVKKFDIRALIEYIEGLEIDKEKLSDDLFEVRAELETLRLANKLIYNTRTVGLETYKEMK